MAWFGLDKLFLGQDLDAEQKRQAELDARIAAANQQLVNRGLWTQAQYDAAQTNIDAGNVSTGANDVVGSVNDEFVAGAKEGLNNVLDAPGKAVDAIGSGLTRAVWGIFKGIPWWLWLAAAAAAFFYMGGGALLKGRLKRYAK